MTRQRNDKGNALTDPPVNVPFGIKRVRVFLMLIVTPSRLDHSYLRLGAFAPDKHFDWKNAFTEMNYKKRCHEYIAHRVGIVQLS